MNGAPPGAFRPERICFIGDSFVSGTGDPDCLGWCGRLGVAVRREGYDLTLYNLGVRRDTSADIAARWQIEASARLPENVAGALVFSFGVNDCLIAGPGQRLVPEQGLHHAETILSRARSWKPTLFIGPPPIGDQRTNRRIQRLSGELAGLCRKLGVPCLEIFSLLARSPLWQRELRTGDGAHPGAAGYRLLAGLIGDWPAWRAWFKD